MQSKPYIPLNSSGDPYELDDLFDDQKWIAFVILQKIHEWFTTPNLSTFEPLRCTINGQAGTGKSVLLNTITSVIRRFTNSNNACIVAAPTGTAAFNVNGETIHSMSSMTENDENVGLPVLGETRKKKLIEKFKDCLVLIFDERSMIPSSLLGKTECIVNQTVFEGRGRRTHHSWGGVPVVVIAGDDYQLGGMGEGAPECLPPFAKFKADKNILRGRTLFKEFASTVFKLPKVRRVDESKQQDAELMDRLRIGERVSDNDVQRLQNLHLDVIEQRHGIEYVNKVKRNAIHLFFRNSKRIEHNLRHLSQMNTTTNPTAVIQTLSVSDKQAKGVRSHFQKQPLSWCLICIGCKVCIRKRNFFPLWGLHNGACGVVVEIVYGKGTNPFSGHLPKYIVVSFPLHRGPAWDLDNPKHIPLPMCSIRCRHKCCERFFCPLDLCFARTFHTCQGLGAGPPEAGKPEHSNHHVILDPDNKDVEKNHTGLFYAGVTRGTTLGDTDGLNSAACFTGPDLTRERIQELALCKDGKHECIKVTKRRHWVEHLDSNTESNADPNTHQCQQIYSHFTNVIGYDYFFYRKINYTNK